MDISNEKNTIRKTILQARTLITEQDVLKKSSIITEKFFQLKEYEISKLVMCYIDFRNEVKTDEIIKKCICDGKRIAVPIVTCCTGENRNMCASEIISVENDLEKGNYGILEPKKDKIRFADPIEIDICIIPGVAFDTNKNRIGYGAGYYDRFLKDVNKECFKVGVAFDEQMVNCLPVEKNDIKLDLIITDKRIIY